MAGVNDVAHTLAEVPQVVMFYDAFGRTQVLEWMPKVGSEDSVIEVTAFVPMAGLTITLLAYTAPPSLNYVNPGYVDPNYVA